MYNVLFIELGLEIWLAVKRTGDSQVSNNKFPFQYIPHHQQSCLFCAGRPDTDQDYARLQVSHNHRVPVMHYIEVKAPPPPPYFPSSLNSGTFGNIRAPVGSNGNYKLCVNCSVVL